MKEYEATLYDAVTVLNVNDSENLKALGIKEKCEYMVSYVFADGRCILYEEIPINKNSPPIIYEYIIKSEDVKHLSFLYNYMDEEEFDDEYYDSEC